MIVTWSFLGIILIIGFIFLGIKMSESVKHGDIKIFFLALYTITLITFINIGISFYFYSKTVKKKGHKGLRGLQGKVGDKGDSGYCEDSCKVNSLKLFLIEKIRELDTTDILKGNVEKIVCGYFNDTTETDLIKNLTIKNFEEIKTTFTSTGYIPNYEAPPLITLTYTGVNIPLTYTKGTCT
jgi:hypothetical protein